MTLADYRTKFLETFNPSVQKDICKNENDCFFGNYLTLSEIKMKFGNNAPVMWLIPQLHNLSEYCGCKDKLRGKPLEECAEVIAQEFYYLKISEIMLFLRRFKAGRYGNFYGSIDPLIITTKLHNFITERNLAIDRHEQEERERRRNEERKGTVTYEQYKEMLINGELQD